MQVPQHFYRKKRDMILTRFTVGDAMRLLKEIFRSRLVGYLVGLLAAIAFGFNPIEVPEEDEKLTRDK